MPSDQRRRPEWAPPVLRGDRLEAGLRAVELRVRRRLDGLLQGNHLGLIPAPGSEPGEARPYQVGDDVRRMDWTVTARTSVPHIRDTIADRELETWLAVDLSPSMYFGTAVCEKRDLAICLAAAVVQFTAGGGNRIGAVVSTGPRTQRIPARGGPAHARTMLREIARIAQPADGTRGDLVALLEELCRPPRRRGLIVLVSDFLGPMDWARPLRVLAARHDLVAAEIVDPRDLDLPDVGRVVLADPESGRQREVDVSPLLRREFAAAAARHRAAVGAAIRGAGAAVLRLRTDSDWIADLVRFAVARKRGRSGGMA